MILSFSLGLATITAPEIDMRLARRVHDRSIATENGQATVALVEMQVTEKGRISDCKVIRFAGVKEIAESLCRAAIRGRMQPARASDGAKVHSVYRTQMSGYSPGDPMLERQQAAIDRNPVQPVATVTDAALPEGLDQNNQAKFNLIVSETGTVSECGPSGTSSDDLARLACAELVPKIFEPFMVEGVAVKHMRNVDVRFDVKQADA